MNALKKIGVVLIVLVILLFVVSLFLPGQMHVERSLAMKAPAENVFVQINTLKNWEKWSPWQKEYPDLRITYNGPESGVGASYSWSSESGNAGSGTLTIVESLPGELVVTDLDFGKDGSGTGGFRIDSDGESSTVTWYMDSRLNGMIDKYMGLLMRGVMNHMFDRGLEDMRKQAESMPVSEATDEPEMFIEEINTPARHYLAIRDSADTQTIGTVLGSDYGLIGEAMRQQGLQQVGAPFAVYYTQSATAWELDAGICVDRQGKASGPVNPGFRPEGRAVVAHYFGNYDGLTRAHASIGKYIADSSRTMAGAPWEEYVTDPMTEKDTSRWQTDVFYPINP